MNRLIQMMCLVGILLGTTHSQATEKPTIWSIEQSQKAGILPLILPDGTLFLPRHDGQHYFINRPLTGTQPTQAEIDGAITASEAQGRIVNIATGGLSIPAALKEVASLPVTFRSKIDDWNYDITVFAMNFTPNGSVLTVGSRFSLPNAPTPSYIYFGANDVVVSGKSGFNGALNILESSLSAAPSTEIGTDELAQLGGETQFFEFQVPTFGSNLKMGLDRNTKMTYDCGAFRSFTLSGYLKSFHVVEQEAADGTIISGNNPFMLFFSPQEVSDWQDMYFEASAIKGFHSQNLKDIGFHFDSNAKIRIDLSKRQNPPNLPSCASIGGSIWKGVYFESFSVRLPKFFNLRSGGSLPNGTGRNLYIDPTGLIGKMTAEKVFSLDEGYIDVSGSQVNKFDMSLDNISADYACNGVIDASMIGQIRTPACGTNTRKAVLDYNIVYKSQNPDYQFLIKEDGARNYKMNSLALSTGSTLALLHTATHISLQATLQEKATLSTPAYHASICNGSSTTITASNCTNNLLWSNAATGATITINPSSDAVYTAACVDKYCVQTISDPLTIKVYDKAAIKPSIVASKTVFCTGETETLTASGTCPGIYIWSTGETDKTSINIPNSTSGTFTYDVYCKLNDCESDKDDENITIKPTPPAPSLVANKTDNKVCSGESITITGSCSTGVFAWTAGVPAGTTSNSYTLVTSNTNLQNIDHVYKATCSENGCSKEQSLTIKEYAIPKPLITYIANRTIAIGEVCEIYAGGCGKDNYLWNDGSSGGWDGTGGSIMKKNLNTTTDFRVRCKMGSCLSDWTPIETIQVKSCEEALPQASIQLSDVNDVLPRTTVRMWVANGGCPSPLTTEWNDGGISLTGGGENFRTVTPSQTTTYKVRCKRDENCKSGWSAGFEVRVVGCEGGLSTPSLSSADNKTSFVEGEIAQLWVSGCGTMSAEWGDGQISNPDINGDNYRNVTILANTDYKVRCVKDSDCKSSWSNTIGIKTITCSESLPIPSLSSANNKTNFVKGETAQLWVSGCGTMSVEWGDGQLSNPDVNGDNYRNVTILVNTDYKVKCVKGSDCKSAWSNILSLYVTGDGENTAPSISASKNSINSTDTDKTVTLTATGCDGGTVTWSDGGTGTPKTVTITATTNYTATCTKNGQTSENSNAVTVSYVNTTVAAPSISASKNSINSTDIDKTVTLTATGCDGGTVTWSAGGTGATKTVTITATTTYTATCTKNGQTSGNSNAVTVSYVNTTVAAPSISASKSSINATDTDKTVTLTATGCDGGTVTWSAGGTGATKTVTITATTTYTATCTKNGQTSGNSNEVNIVFVPAGCNSTVANSTPSVTKELLCDGQVKFSLSEPIPEGFTCQFAIGWTNIAGWHSTDQKPGSEYITDGGRSNSTIKCWYQKIGDDKCQSLNYINSELTNSAMSSPMNLSASPASIVNSANSLLSASCNRGVPKWYSDSQLTNPISNLSVSPSITTTYYAICESGNCKSAYGSVTVTVVSKPSAPIISSNKTMVCGTDKAVITATGCTGGIVKWDNGSTGTSINVGVGTYRATCINVVESDLSNIIKIENPKKESPTNVTRKSNCNEYVFSANCPNGYTVSWARVYFSDGMHIAERFTGNVKSFTSKPQHNDMRVGCSPDILSECFSYDVDPGDIEEPIKDPMFNGDITASKQEIYTGETTELRASCSTGQLVWSDDINALGNRIVKPTETKTYTASCKNSPCSDVSKSITITVKQPDKEPTLISGNTHICKGEQANLTVEGCTSYLWSDNTTSSTKTIIVNDNMNITVQCTGVGANGKIMSIPLYVETPANVKVYKIAITNLNSNNNDPRCYANIGYTYCTGKTIAYVCADYSKVVTLESTSIPVNQSSGDKACYKVEIKE